MSSDIEKESLTGRIFKYGNTANHIAFQSGDMESRDHVIMISGMTQGLYDLPYIKRLSEELTKMHWSLVQAQLTSSFIGYGLASLKQDAKEIDLLIEYLTSKLNARSFVIAGHSTGCQIAVQYMDTGAYKNRVKGVILQAPVSDREYIEQDPKSKEYLAIAQKLIAEGKSESLMAREVEAFGTPITAYRYNSLVEKMADDDMFSSDLSDQELTTKLGHLKGVPTLFALGESDESYPSHVDVKKLASRFANLTGGDSIVIHGGSHSLKSDIKHQGQFLQSALDLMKKIHI